MKVSNLVHYFCSRWYCETILLREVGCLLEASRLLTKLRLQIYLQASIYDMRKEPTLFKKYTTQDDTGIHSCRKFDSTH